MHLSNLLLPSAQSTANQYNVEMSAIHVIQSWYRKRLYKEWKNYTTTPIQSVNTTDFFTFQPIGEIPFYRRFFLYETSNFFVSTPTSSPHETEKTSPFYVFGFDMDSFYQLLHHSTTLTDDSIHETPRPSLNPYTRNPITDKQLYTFYRTVQLHKMLFPFFPWKIKQSMSCLNLFENNSYLLIRYYPRSYDVRIKILMEELADLEPEWEVVQGIRWWKAITSDLSKAKLLYKVLSIMLKRNTYPLYHFIRFPQRATSENTALLCLEMCEYFLLALESTKEERESVATLIFTALTVVSKDIRAVFPWFFKNYW